MPVVFWNHGRFPNESMTNAPLFDWVHCHQASRPTRGSASLVKPPEWSWRSDALPAENRHRVQDECRRIRALGCNVRDYASLCYAMPRGYAYQAAVSSLSRKLGHWSPFLQA
jgi:hypothetical protein